MVRSKFEVDVHKVVSTQIVTTKLYRILHNLCKILRIQVIITMIT